MKRKIAAALGLRSYDAEKVHTPCGTKERYVSTGGCVRCGKLRRVSLPEPKRLYPLDEIPTTRDAAIQMDSKFYKPTTPCKNGHLAKRYTRSAICTRCNVVAAAKLRRSTPDQTKRASGLVSVESWVYPDQVDELKAFERSLLSRRNRENPAERPIPILPRSDRHPDDYEMK